jgi:steroid delta-isomerase-like uncharacterized protein
MGTVNRGQDEVRTFLRRRFAAFPDFHIAGTTAFSNGTWVGTESVMSATHLGDPPGLPTTGRPFSVRGASVFELQGGTIHRNPDYRSMATFLQQIGVRPVPPSHGGQVSIT